MANVAHSTLTGANLHEPKGVAAATAGQVYIADGAATGTWGKLTSTSLQTTGNPFGAQLLHIRDEKASGTQAGTFTAGSWQTRVINTVKTNEISGASLAANQVTLPAGTYDCMGNAPANQCGNHQLKLYNVTDASDTIIGTTEASASGSNQSFRSWVNGRFTIAGAKVFELRHQCGTTRGTDGLGEAGGFGVVEVYAEVRIWKVA